MANLLASKRSNTQTLDWILQGATTHIVLQQRGENTASITSNTEMRV
jgi:hypothetical protein